jgi:hypothetical protein
MENNTSAPASPTPITLPTSWPGAWAIYKLSKAVVMFNLGTILTLSVISFLLNGSLSRVGNGGDLLGAIIQAIATVGIIVASFAGLESKKVSISEAITAGFSKVGVKMFFLNILIVIISVISFVLLIVPWVIIFPRILLAPYLLVKENLGIIESLERSWELTKGHNGKVWGIIGVSIVFALLCIVLIGFYFLLMYVAAWAILTAYLLSTKESAPVVAEVPAASEPSEPTPAA